MKRYIYILCAVLMGVFASCSKSEIGEQTSPSNQVTLKVTADEWLPTRANATGVDRFAIEVYTDAAYTAAANVFSDGTNKSNNATGIFTMVLDRTQAYYCLLWADKSGSSVYDLTSLKAVTLTGNAVEAWHGTTTIAAGTTAALTAELTRAVSKISLMETGKLKLGSTLKLNFSQPTKFNVVDGTTSTTVARTEESISIAADVDGTITPVKLNTADIFVLSSVATADLTDLTFKFNAEAEFTVSQAPLKANFNTNIKGHYTSSKNTTFTATADGEWGASDNEAVISVSYAIGDLYPNATAPIGVVFWVDESDPTYNTAANTSAKGKIVSLDEATSTRWSTETIVTDATSDTDGAGNTAKVFALATYIANNATYPAFAWCATKNTTAPAGIKWYIPAKTELKALYGKYTDGTDDNVDAGVKTTVNASLSSVSGAAQLSGFYWSSTESNVLNACFVNFNYGTTPNNNKNDDFHSVRVVSAF